MTVTAPHQGELRAHLERVVALRLGVQHRISSVERRPSAYRSSFQVEEIDIRLDEGTTLELIAKATAWSAMSPDAHRARPSFLRDEEREPATYESIVSAFDVRTARYFGTYVDATGARWLLLERIAGTPLWQRGDFDAWREAARWLARMHVRVGPDTVANTRAAAHLLRYDRRFYECWMHRACAFHEDLDGALGMLGDRYTRVVDRLLAQPTTFIHGEFYPANILVNGDRGGTVNVCPIDWEMAGLGPALIDLACLLSGGWTADQRADLAEAYYREIGAHGGDVPSPEHYLRTLDCCLIHLSVRNLGWSPDWSPPPGHAHDWLGDALRLSEKWQQ